SVFDDDDLSLNYLRSTKKRHSPVVMHSAHRKIYPSPRQDELQTEKMCQRELSNNILQKQLKDVPIHNIQFYQGKGNQLHEERMDHEEEGELQARNNQKLHQEQDRQTQIQELHQKIFHAQPQQRECEEREEKTRREQLQPGRDYQQLRQENRQQQREQEHLQNDEQLHKDKERQLQMMRQRQKELSLLENARQEQQRKRIFLQEQHSQPTSPKPRVVLTDEQVTPSISMKSFQLPNVSLSIGDNRQYRRMSNLGGTSTQGPLSALRTLTDNYRKLEIDKDNADQRINQLEKEVEQYRQLLQKEQVKIRSLEADSRANKVKGKDGENHADKENLRLQKIKKVLCGIKFVELENRVNSLHKKYEALKRQLEYSRQYTLRAEEERDEAKKALIIAKQEIAIINKEYEDLKAAAQNQRTRPQGTSSPRSIATRLSLTSQPQQDETIRVLKNENRKNAISSKERYDNLRNSSHGSSSPEQTNHDHEKRRSKKKIYQERVKYSSSMEENGNVAPQVFQRPASSRGFENRYIDPKYCEQIKDPCEEPQRETELSSGNNKKFNNMRDNSRCSSQESDQQVKTTKKYQDTEDEHYFVNTGNKRKHSRYERNDRYSNDPSDDSDDRIEEREHNDHFGRQNRQVNALLNMDQPRWRDVKNGKSYLKKRVRDVTETRLRNAKGSGDHREVPFIGTGKSDSVTVNLQQAFVMAKHHDTNSCSVCKKKNHNTDENANTRHHHTEELGLNHDTPDIALTKVICNLTDELAHLKINLVDEYQAIDPVDSKSIRTALAEEMKGVMDDMEMKGDQIAMLYDVHKKTIKLSSRESETTQRINSRQSNNMYTDDTAEFSRNQKKTQNRNLLRRSQKVQEIFRHDVVTNGEIAIMKYT
ncbi:18506_t:CDS:10, partial [Acaulospora morrowiae]